MRIGPEFELKTEAKKYAEIVRETHLSVIVVKKGDVYHVHAGQEKTSRKKENA